MNEKKTYQLFSPSGCLTQEALVSYSNKSLPENEMQEIKLHLEECAFCTDAMEGVGLLESPASLFSISNELNIAIDKKVEIKKKGKTSLIKRLVPIAVAASITIAFGLFMLLYEGNDNIADNTKIDKITEKEEDPVVAQETTLIDSTAVSGLIKKDDLTEKELSNQIVSGKINNTDQLLLDRAETEAKSTVFKEKLIEESFDDKEVENAKDLSPISTLDNFGASTTKSEDFSQLKELESDETLYFSIVVDERNDLDVDMEEEETERGIFEGTGGYMAEEIAKEDKSTPQSKSVLRKTNKKGTSATSRSSMQKMEVQNAPVTILTDSVAPGEFSGNRSPQFSYNNLNNYEMYVQSQIDTSSTAFKNSPTGSIFIQFYINKLGYIENPQIIRGLTNDINNHILQIIKSSPKWQPGLYEGEPSKNKITMEILVK